MIDKFKGKTKIQCKCGKYHWIPTYYIKRKIGLLCSKECVIKYRKKGVILDKYSICDKCNRTYLTKLGCLFCRTLIKDEI